MVQFADENGQLKALEHKNFKPDGELIISKHCSGVLKNGKSSIENQSRSRSPEDVVEDVVREVHEASPRRDDNEGTGDCGGGGDGGVGDRSRSPSVDGKNGDENGCSSKHSPRSSSSSSSPSSSSSQSSSSSS